MFEKNVDYLETIKNQTLPAEKFDEQIFRKSLGLLLGSGCVNKLINSNVEKSEINNAKPKTNYDNFKKDIEKKLEFPKVIKKNDKTKPPSKIKEKTKEANIAETIKLEANKKILLELLAKRKQEEKDKKKANNKKPIVSKKVENYNRKVKKLDEDYGDMTSSDEFESRSSMYEEKSEKSVSD